MMSSGAMSMTDLESIYSTRRFAVQFVT